MTLPPLDAVAEQPRPVVWSCCGTPHDGPHYAECPHACWRVEGKTCTVRRGRVVDCPCALAAPLSDDPAQPSKQPCGEIVADGCDVFDPDCQVCQSANSDAPEWTI